MEKYSDAILSRLTDATNSNNTLEHRWIQSEALLKSKVLRPMTLIGAGYGEITELKNSVFMENSILYYLWKYGVAVTICMLITILHNSWMAFRSHVPQLRAVKLELAYCISCRKLFRKFKYVLFRSCIEFRVCVPSNAQRLLF